MIEEEPNIVTSGKSQRVIIDGYPFSIEIYRAETDQNWMLEVVDQDGTSHVWDDQFASDKEARDAAVQTIEEEGAIAFMRGDNVIRFPER
ncbi:hypothetical protein D3P06_19075 [Paracoccus aestuarii]|uniref:Uncharacterized protein n=2 Tax=Paracoccus aestuarii TaxID=453842 RepID=A0A418ZPL6_9RHOB|nr:hypothetical protein D3P06_19075 [Paracoccus aestuarii]WCR00826.1 hypothetical protein JHW48_15045 [Paracoccus aestuarii]